MTETMFGDVTYWIKKQAVYYYYCSQPPGGDVDFLTSLWGHRHVTNLPRNTQSYWSLVGTLWNTRKVPSQQWFVGFSFCAGGCEPRVYPTFLLSNMSRMPKWCITFFVSLWPRGWCLKKTKIYAACWIWVSMSCCQVTEVGSETTTGCHMTWLTNNSKNITNTCLEKQELLVKNNKRPFNVLVYNKFDKSVNKHLFTCLLHLPDFVINIRGLCKT